MGVKISQAWPDFHHFWICGHIMPKHITKLHMDNIPVMINMYVEFEINLRGYILEIFKMDIKWPTLKKKFIFH